MLSVRGNTFSDGVLGEPEQDANSALTELDKGRPIIIICSLDLKYYEIIFYDQLNFGLLITVVLKRVQIVHVFKRREI